MDGKCSAAIVYKFYKQGTYIEMDYTKNFPFDTIEKDELIVIVDFMLDKVENFDKLLTITNNIIWIDHHKSSIEKYKDIAIQGERKSGTAACVLTWEYFYGEDKLPRIIEMLGDYDIWDFSKHGEDLNKLQAGIKLFNSEPTNENWNTWLNTTIETNEMFQIDFHNDDLELLLNLGETALKFRTKQYEEYIKHWGFWTKFEGYKAIACNSGFSSSFLFDSIKEDYDIMLSFNFNGEQWAVSIYSRKSDIDCSDIAKKYGGGGHKGAAGFQCKELPFIPKIKENK
jgi:oligoribonuclease NrnB/cAMP/cGMP phosphodiesterase (DHH superfamily)